VCIVEQPTDILLFDKTGYSGKFYVLGSLISPLDGIGPDDISIKRLIDRIGEFNEVIIGLDTSAEGDATSLYLTDLLKGYSLKVTRLSRGIPIGGSFDYIDSATLARSINDRTSIET
jgi:recombination protein RecR